MSMDTNWPAKRAIYMVDQSIALLAGARACALAKADTLSVDNSYMQSNPRRCIFFPPYSTPALSPSSKFSSDPSLNYSMPLCFILSLPAYSGSRSLRRA